MENQKVETPKELTLGEQRVGITFNPSKVEEVNVFKQLAAKVIDNYAEKEAIDSLHTFIKLVTEYAKKAKNPEVSRAYATALYFANNCNASFGIEGKGEKNLVAIETAAMWAVKAATKTA